MKQKVYYVAHERREWILIPQYTDAPESHTAPVTHSQHATLNDCISLISPHQPPPAYYVYKLIDMSDL